MGVVQCVSVVVIPLMVAIQVKFWRDLQPPVMLLAPGVAALILELCLAFLAWAFWGLDWVALVMIIMALMEGGFLIFVGINVLR